MLVHINTVLALEGADILAGPHIVDDELGARVKRLERWDLVKLGRHLRTGIPGIEHKDVHACDGRAGPVLGRMQRVVGAVLVVSPFVWHGPGAVEGVLVEGDELPVGENLKHRL